MQGGYFEANIVKFETLELRAGGIPVESAQLGDFGLVQDGCKLNQSHTILRNVLTSEFVLRLDKSVRVNGYFFQTSNDSFELDPVKWIVKASADNGSSWNEVGASIWRLNTDGTTVLYPQLAFDTTVERGHFTIFDFRRPWRWCLVSIVRGVVLFTGTFASLYYAIAGHEESAKMSWIVMFSVLGLCFITSAAWCNWTGLLREAIVTWIYVVECFVIPIGLAYFESKCVAMLFLFSFLGAFDSLIADCVVYGDGSGCSLVNSLQNIYIFFFTATFAAFVTLFHHRILQKARSLILRDKKVYDRLWQDIVQDPTAQADLQTLKMNAKRHYDDEFGTAEMASPDPRQYNPYLLERQKSIQRAQALQRRSSWYDAFGQIHPGEGIRRLSRAATALGLSITLHRNEEINARISSLDQLFAQAYCLHPLLISKVKIWARESGGCVKISDGHTHKYVRYSELESQQHQHIVWCKSKSLQRAIEKVVRAYGQVREAFNGMISLHI